MGGVEIENDVTFDDTLYNNKRWSQIQEKCFKPKIPQVQLLIRHNYCKEVKGMLSGETGKTMFEC